MVIIILKSEEYLVARVWIKHKSNKHVAKMRLYWPPVTNYLQEKFIH